MSESEVPQTGVKASFWATGRGMRRAVSDGWASLSGDLTWRRAGRLLLFVLVAGIGAWVALMLGGGRTDHVGPLVVESSVGVSLTGDSVIDVPPLGSIVLDTHDGPLAISAQVSAVDTEMTRAALSGSVPDADLDTIAAQVRHLLIWSYVQALVVSAVGAGLAVLLVWRRPRHALLASGVAVGLVLAAAATAVITWNSSALTQPRYTGLLVFVPQVVGDADVIVDNFEEYGAQLGGLVQNVARLSGAARTLPSLTADADAIRALHVSDIHLNPNVWPVMRSIIEQYDIDLVVDTGDIADHGTGVENSLLSPIESLGVPYVYIRGNHDSATTAAAIANMSNTTVVSDEVVDVEGLTIAGIGDPRFTPDKSTEPTDDAVVASGEELASTIESSIEDVDVALVHDPITADPLVDVVPLVLAGHRHERAEEDLSDQTELLVQGSTGGAGLRALEEEEPTPLTLTVLYFDRTTGQLSARDEITLGGLGAASAEVKRVVEEGATP